MNKERKELYYRSVKPNGTQKKVIDAAEIYDEKNGTEICLWDTKTTQEFLKEQNYIFPLDIYTAQQAIRSFVDYCARKGDLCDYDVMEMGIEDFICCINKDLVKKYYIPRNEYLRLVNTMENPVDRFILLGVYEGIHAGVGNNEMMDVKLSDLSGNTLKLSSGRIINVSNELIEFMNISEQTYEYYGTRTVRLDTKRDYVIKPTYRLNSGLNAQAFTRRIERLIEDFAGNKNLDQLTPLRIMEIGRFDFVKRKVEKGEYTFDELFSWAADGKAYIHENQYGVISRRKLIRKFYEWIMEL